MANTAGMCVSWKQQIMVELNTDALKAALYTPSANISAATTAYTSSGEVASSGSYSSGGTNVVNGTVATSGNVAYWTPTTSWTWTGVTFQTDCALLYNTSKTNRAIAALTFGSTSVTAGNFGLSMPANDANFGLVRLQ